MRNFLHHPIFRITIITFTIIIFATAPNALNIENKLKNPALEQRAQDIFRNIRCMVCAGESIADSRVDLAKDLRKLVREKIEDGYTTKQILEYATLRYGDIILMQPPLKPATYLLWYGPLFILLAGFIVVLFSLSKHKN
jgi:cytochrome c-type biogenesis protein CcmH